MVPGNSTLGIQIIFQSKSTVKISGDLPEWAENLWGLGSFLSQVAHSHTDLVCWDSLFHQCPCKGETLPLPVAEAGWQVPGHSVSLTVLLSQVSGTYKVPVSLQLISDVLLPHSPQSAALHLVLWFFSWRRRGLGTSFQPSWISKLETFSCFERR